LELQILDDDVKNAQIVNLVVENLPAPDPVIFWLSKKYAASDRSKCSGYGLPRFFKLG
jgi:hypothetical protein